MESVKQSSDRVTAAEAATGYRSPPGKLIKFFKQSRDGWKAKCLEAKARGKGLKHQLRFVEKSKATWKSRVQALEGELAQVRAEQRVLAEELAALKKSAPQQAAAGERW